MATHMTFVTHGALEYAEGVLNRSQVMNSVKFGPDQWICEAALWLRWKHVGDLRSVGGSTDVVTVSAHQFQQVASNHHAALGDMQTYAKLFIDSATTLHKPNFDTWG